MKKMIAFLTSVLTVASATLPISSFATSATYLSGDVNLDGIVDTNDSNLLTKALWGQVSLNDVQRTVADINGDLHVNFSDLIKLNGIINGSVSSSEITVDADENGNISHFLNNNSALALSANGWVADVNNENGSSFQTSAYSMTAKSNGSSMFLNPYFVNISNSNASLSHNPYITSSETRYSDGKITANVLNNGYISINDSYLSQSKSVVQKAGETLNYISKDDIIFQPTNYGVGGTVELFNASVTRREDGYEFCNNISKNTGTINSFLGHKYAYIGDAEFWFDTETNSFTFDGVDTDSIELVHEDIRYAFNGSGIVPFNELSLVTNDYIYGIMYDPTCDWMCASVQYNRSNGECVLSQYTSAGDRATIATHYAQDGIVDEGLADPDHLVEYLDELYDPDAMVFQTIMYKNKMKMAIIGGINSSYRTNNGVTFTQTSTGLNILQATNSDKDTGTTITFGNVYGNEVFAMANQSGSVEKFGNTIAYKLGTESFTTDASESLFSPDKPITYASDNVKETFNVRDILNQRTATMY